VRVRAIGRLLLPAIFITGGFEAIRKPGPRVPLAQPIVGALARALPGRGLSVEQVVRADGVAKVVGGLALASGLRPRAAALGLAVSLVPTTLAGHRFWSHTDPKVRAAQRVQFTKNVSLLGGLLLAAGG
jgi:putative oxidoreductase